MSENHYGMPKRVKRHTKASAVLQARNQIEHFLYNSGARVLHIAGKSNSYVVPSTTIPHYMYRVHLTLETRALALRIHSGASDPASMYLL